MWKGLSLIITFNLSLVCTKSNQALFVLGPWFRDVAMKFSDRCIQWKGATVAIGGFEDQCSFSHAAAGCGAAECGGQGP
jgi:hypothetical protein